MSSVDVIVPCYRYGRFLRECVESVLAQPGVKIRVLIIDDASPDETAEVATDIISKDSRVTLLRHSTNKGHIETYNEGVEWASANYSLLLSADDYLLPGALQRAVDLMEAHPELGFTFGKALILHGDSWRIQNLNATDTLGWRIVIGLEFIELSGARDIVPTPTAVVRTELQKRLGGYRPELPHTADMEMWLRLAAHSSVGVLEAYQAVYRRHSANMSSTYRREGFISDLRHRKAALDCFFQSWNNILPKPQQLRRRCTRSLAYDAIRLASAAFNDGEIEMCKQLADYALVLWPQLKRSFPWTKLTWKRRMGYKVWVMFRPAADGTRDVAPVSSLERHVKLISGPYFESSPS
jgi:glycosyltransferase involved in cell wall biosynthesis